MTRGVHTVGPDWSVGRLVEFLTDHSISGAPVVGDDGAPLGVVSVTDIARSRNLVETVAEHPHSYFTRGIERAVAREELKNFHGEDESEATVRDIMTPVVFSVEETATVQDVADAMVRGRIHRVFITKNSKMVGVISSLDLLPLIRDM
jgi:CBS domain-containing protein